MKSDAAVSTAASPSGVSLRVTVWGLAAMALCILWMRAHLYEMPQYRDTANYAVLAREWALGRPLYTDLWLHSPPGIVWAYWVTRAVVGDGPQEMFALGLACAWATLLAVYYAAAAMARRHGAGLWAAGFWTIFSGSLPLQSNLPSCEVVMALCTAGTLALLARPRANLSARASAARWFSVVGAGVLLALDSMVKQVTLPITLAVAAAHVVWPPQSTSRRRATAEASTLLGVSLFAWAGLLAWLWLNRALPAFWEANVAFNVVYSKGAGSSGMLANVLAFGRSNEPMLYDLRWVLVLLVVTTGLVLTKWSAATPHARALLAASAAGSYFAVALPGNFYDHYFQLVVPNICVAAGVIFVSPFPRLGFPRLRLSPAVGALSAAALLFVNDRYYTQPAWLWPELQFHTFQDNECQMMSLLAARLLQPNETLFDWGDDPQLYFYTGSRSPTGLLFSATVLLNPRYQGPWSARQHAQALADLKRTLPELMVMYAYGSVDADDNTVGAWLAANYRRRPECIGLLSLFQRVNGRLASQRPR